MVDAGDAGLMPVPELGGEVITSAAGSKQRPSYSRAAQRAALFLWTAYML
jgi:hypothetical protein